MAFELSKGTSLQGRAVPQSKSYATRHKHGPPQARGRVDVLAIEAFVALRMRWKPRWCAAPLTASIWNGQWSGMPAKKLRQGMAFHADHGSDLDQMHMHDAPALIAHVQMLLRRVSARLRALRSAAR